METWLSPNILTDVLLLLSFNSPERNDRIGDAHGGDIVYVKEGIRLEIVNNKEKVLFGFIYRAPNSDGNYFSSIEDTIS